MRARPMECLEEDLSVPITSFDVGQHLSALTAANVCSIWIGYLVQRTTIASAPYGSKSSRCRRMFGNGMKEHADAQISSAAERDD